MYYKDVWEIDGSKSPILLSLPLGKFIGALGCRHCLHATDKHICQSSERGTVFSSTLAFVNLL